MRERVRCNACRRRGFHGRFVLAQNFTAYKQDPKCPRCKSTDLSVYTKISRRHEAKVKQRGGRCFCHEYPFPHKKGTMRFCVHNKKRLAGIEPTVSERATYESTLETQRG